MKYLLPGVGSPLLAGALVSKACLHTANFTQIIQNYYWVAVLGQMLAIARNILLATRHSVKATPVGQPQSMGSYAKLPLWWEIICIVFEFVKTA